MASIWLTLQPGDLIRTREYFDLRPSRYRYVRIDLGSKEDPLAARVSATIDTESIAEWERLAATITEACRRLRESVSSVAPADVGTESPGTSLSEETNQGAAARRQEA